MNTYGSAGLKRAYSVREASDILGVSERFLYECVRTNRIQAVRLGHRWIIPAGSLASLLRESEPTPAAAVEG